MTRLLGFAPAVLALWAASCVRLLGQGADPKLPGGERWSFRAQVTSVAQTHGSFSSPYSSLNSFHARQETRVSVTGTLFVGVRLRRGTEVYVNPEIAGGKGLSDVLGLAAFPNGDITRVTAPTPKLYLSRVFVRQTWALGDDLEQVEAGPNQLASHRPVRRFTLTAGKIALPDLFDDNAYDHDPRTQFMNWALMDQGTWDYPADTRGYTVAVVAELNRQRWALRAASAMVSRVVNGLELDTHLRRNHGEVVELETRHKFRGQSGKLRWLAYVNHANMGRYREALRTAGGAAPDVGKTERPGTPKYGLGLNIEQALNRDIGLFLRLGWNDGKTESWMFTEIDRTLHLGFQFNGKTWARPQDAWGFSLVSNGLSRDHRDYLTAGGFGFMLGDGRLSYSSERVLEAYYNLELRHGFGFMLDYQRAQNPGYNRDRGPASILGLRFHWER